MPTYEYKCDHCNHAMEVLQSIMAKPIKKCPACGKLKLKRLLGTGVGLIFKGSGFYETDYRSDSYKKAAESEKPSTGDTKTDSTKETKTETTKTEISSTEKTPKGDNKKPAKQF